MTDHFAQSANIFSDINELHRLIDVTQLLPKLIRRQQEEKLLQIVDIESLGLILLFQPHLVLKPSIRFRRTQHLFSSYRPR